MMGLAGLITDQQKLALDGKIAELNAAVQRTQVFGSVTSAADAELLGIPVGTSTQDAINAANNLAFQYEQLEVQKASDADASARGWASIKLDQDRLAYQKEQDNKKTTEPAPPTDAEIRAFQGQFGVDYNTAEDIALILRAPTKEAALADLAAAKQAAQSQGITINEQALMNAIESKWPTVDVVSGAAPTATSTSTNPTYDFSKLPKMVNGVQMPYESPLMSVILNYLGGKKTPQSTGNQGNGNYPLIIPQF
jgi:hypothetical protein